VRFHVGQDYKEASMSVVNEPEPEDVFGSKNLKKVILSTEKS
jgi:hypothetical protein